MSKPIFKPIILRGGEEHRQATWLELFLDLAFVISIAALTKMLVKDHSAEGIALYAGLFLAVYWAWNQLTWYATHFDNDDVFFRVMYLAAILAVLILASSVEKIAQGETALFVRSYVFFQALLAAGWWRVRRQKAEFRKFSLIMILGQVIGSLIWIGSLWFEQRTQYALWGVALFVHILGPYIAWRTKTFDIPVNTRHVVERYCLMTIIVMGETLVAVSAGFASAQSAAAFPVLSGAFPALSAYIIVACIWWTYFAWDFERVRTFDKLANAFVFGYGHFVVFLAIAVFGAGVENLVHSTAHGGHSTLLGRMLIAVPPCLYLVSLSVINRFAWNMPFGTRMKVRVGVGVLSLAGALAVGHLSPLLLLGVIALLMVGLVVHEHASGHRAE